MMARALTTACLCTGLFQVASVAAPPERLVGSAPVDYSMAVSGLPWEFNQPAVTIDEQEARAGISTRYQFVSTEPLARTAQQYTYLRVALTVTSYVSQERAVEDFKLIGEQAHPDMGLSYAWDYLLLDDRTLYHLHTGCSMSRDNFDIIVSNLWRAVLPEGDNEPRALRCRCGGGCRTSP